MSGITEMSGIVQKSRVFPYLRIISTQTPLCFKYIVISNSLSVVFYYILYNTHVMIRDIKYASIYDIFVKLCLLKVFTSLLKSHNDQQNLAFLTRKQ